MCNDLTEEAFFEKCQQDTTEGAIYRKTHALIQNPTNQEAILRGFPKRNIKRRNTGYALDFVLEMAQFQEKQPFNLSKKD